MVARGRYQQEKSKQSFKTPVVLLAPLPQRLWGSTIRDFHVEFDFLGMGCNHAVLEQLEAKNLQTLAVFDNTWLFLRGFWLLAALEEHGCIPNLENRILHINPKL